MSVTTLAFTGYGLASSLGGAITAAAAFRAGIVRAAYRESFSVDLPDGEEAPVACHAARPVTEGFELHGLWLRLADLALADLRMNLTRAGQAWETCWRDTALIVVLPAITAERFGAPDPAPHEDCLRWFLHPLLASLPERPRSHVLLARGASGVADGILRVQVLCAAGEVTRGIVLAVDSLCDRSSLEWLVASGRLKLPGHPVGLQPGEAAVCLVVEPIVGEPRPGQVVIAGAAHDLAPRTDVGPSGMTGMLAGQAGRRCLEQVRPGTQRLVADHYVDLNGEEERSLAWGHLLAQTTPWMVLSQRESWYPVGGFGDTGAASAALACVLAIRAIERGYARTATALVWTNAESTGAPAVIMLEHCR